MKEFIEEFLFERKDEIQAKEMSLDDRLSKIREGIRGKFNPQGGVMVDESAPYYWVQHVYDGYAIVNRDEKYFKVDYSLDEDGSVAIGEIQEVEMAWVMSGKGSGEPYISFEKDPSSDNLMVFKGKDDEYRWIMFSSNAFQDRDGEIVSRKALEVDVERADQDGDYGPLRWWHIGIPDMDEKSAGPGLDIGDCDFNAMHGKILIESGTFRDQEIGEAIAGKASDLQGSILFFHPADEPDKDGVFHNIYRAERSLLPTGKASNSLVSLLVNKKESEMDIKEKWDNFIELVGGEEKVNSALKQAELTEETAEILGIASKDKEEEETPEVETEETPGEEPESEEEKFLGEMTPEKFQEIQQKGLKEYFEPMTVQVKGISESQSHLLDAQTSMKEVMESQAEQLKVVTEKVAELEGETPSSQTGYRPSQDDETVVKDDSTVKGKEPGVDPEFVDFMLPGNSA